VPESGQARNLCRPRRDRLISAVFGLGKISAG